MARVDDIFEEVTRQMNSLKRQAAKAERFAAVRDELRDRLRVVLASRMALMDADQARLVGEIALLTERINASALEIETAEASQHALTARGYELDSEGQEAQNRANTAAVELERAAARERSNVERVSELEVRITSAGAELEQTRTQLAGIAEEREQQRSFMATAAEETRAFRAQVEARQQEARAAAEEVFASERQLEANRRHVMHLLTLASNARNHTASRSSSPPVFWPCSRMIARIAGQCQQMHHVSLRLASNCRSEAKTSSAAARASCCRASTCDRKALVFSAAVAIKLRCCSRSSAMPANCVRVCSSSAPADVIRNSSSLTRSTFERSRAAARSNSTAAVLARFCASCPSLSSS